MITLFAALFMRIDAVTGQLFHLTDDSLVAACNSSLLEHRFLHPIYPIQSYPYPSEAPGPYATLVQRPHDPQPFCFKPAVNSSTIRIGFRQALLITGVTTWGANQSWLAAYSLWSSHRGIRDSAWEDDDVPYYEEADDARVFIADTADAAYYSLRRPFMAMSIQLKLHDVNVSSSSGLLCLAIKVHGCYESRFSCPEHHPLQHGMTCYQMQNASMFMQDALGSCNRSGGQLPTIEYPLQNRFLRDLLATGRDAKIYFYIGLNDLIEDDKYGWLNSTTNPQYTHYAESEVEIPNTDSQHCAVISNATGDWDFTKCSKKYPFICKMPAINSTDECLGEWLHWRSGCYRAFTTRATWQVAREACIAEGADLTTILDWEEQDVITNLITTHVWLKMGSIDGIAFHRHDANSTRLKWFLNWASDHPKPYTRESDKVFMSAEAGLTSDANWMDSGEGVARQFACMVPSNGICPFSFTLYEGMCILVSSSKYNYYNARLECADNQALLGIITNHDIQHKLSESLVATLWLDAEYDSVTTSHKWKDGTPFGYARWSLGEPRLEEGNCSIVASDGKWRSAKCLEEHRVVCVKAQPSGCFPDWYSKERGGIIYILQQTPRLSLLGAEEFCLSEWNGHLASIEDEEDNAWITTFLQSLGGFQRVLFGLHKWEVSWEWFDNSTSNYTNWTNQNPNHGPGDAQAVVLTYDGTWIDTHSKTRLPFLCKSQATEALKTMTSVGQESRNQSCDCEAEWRSLWGHCVHLPHNTSHVDYQVASAVCGDLGGHLPIISSYTQQQNIIEEILVPSMWISLSDSRKEDVFVWDGWANQMNYTSWAHGQPIQPSLAANCATMRADGYWTTNDCRLPAQFFCEYPYTAVPYPMRTELSVNESLIAGQSFSGEDGTWNVHFDNSTGSFGVYLHDEYLTYEIPARGSEITLTHTGDLVMFNNSVTWNAGVLGQVAPLVFTPDGALVLRNADSGNIIWSNELSRYDGYVGNLDGDSCFSLLEQEQYQAEDVFSASLWQPHAEPYLASLDTPWVGGEVLGGWVATLPQPWLPARAFFQVTLGRRHRVGRLVLLRNTGPEKPTKFTAQLQTSVDGASWANATCGSHGMRCKGDRSDYENIIEFSPPLVTAFLRLLAIHTTSDKTSLRIDLHTCSENVALHSSPQAASSDEPVLVDGDTTTCMSVTHATEVKVTVTLPRKQWVEVVRLTSSPYSALGEFSLVALLENIFTDVITYRGAVGAGESISLRLARPILTSRIGVRRHGDNVTLSLCEIEAQHPTDLTSFPAPSWQSHPLMVYALNPTTSVVLAHQLSHDIIFARLLVTVMSGVNEGFSFEENFFETGERQSEYSSFTFYFNESHATIMRTAFVDEAFYCVGNTWSTTYKSCNATVVQLILQLWTLCDFPPPAIFSPWTSLTSDSHRTINWTHGLGVLPVLAYGQVKNTDTNINVHGNVRSSTTVAEMIIDAGLLTNTLGVVVNHSISVRFIIWTNLASPPAHEQTFSVTGGVGPEVILPPPMWSSRSGLLLFQILEEDTIGNRTTNAYHGLLYAHAPRTMRLWWNISTSVQPTHIKLYWYTYGVPPMLGCGFLSLDNTSIHMQCAAGGRTIEGQCLNSGSLVTAQCNDSTLTWNITGEDCQGDGEWSELGGYDYLVVDSPMDVIDSLAMCSNMNGRLVRLLHTDTQLTFLRQQVTSLLTGGSGVIIPLDWSASLHHLINLTYLHDVTSNLTNSSTPCLLITPSDVTLQSCHTSRFNATVCMRPVSHRHNLLGFTRVRNMRPPTSPALAYVKAHAGSDCLSRCARLNSSATCRGVVYEKLSTDCFMYTSQHIPTQYSPQTTYGNGQLYRRRSKRVKESLWELLVSFKKDAPVSFAETLDDRHNTEDKGYTRPHEVLDAGESIVISARFKTFNNVYKVRLSLMDEAGEVGFLLFTWSGASPDTWREQLNQNHLISSTYDLIHFPLDRCPDPSQAADVCLATCCTPNDSQQTSNITNSVQYKGVDGVFRHANVLVIHGNAACRIPVSINTPASQLTGISPILGSSTHLIFTADPCHNSKTGSRLLLYQDARDENYKAYYLDFSSASQSRVQVTLTYVMLGYERVYYGYDYVTCRGQHTWLWLDWQYGHVQLGQGEYVEADTRVLEVFIEDEPVDVAYVSVVQDEGVWSLPTERSCVPLYLPNTVQTWVRADDLCSVQVDCDVGNWHLSPGQLQGQPRFTTICKADGSWSETTDCQRTPCFLSVTHSNSTNVAVVYDDVIHVVCDEGYHVTSQAYNHTAFTTRCIADGKWTTLETCQAITCHPVNVTFSNVTGIPGMAGDTVGVQCIEGHVFNGTVFSTFYTIRCSLDGQWLGLIDCAPVECGPPPPGTNTLRFQDASYTTHYNSTVLYSCTPGYVIDSGDASTCQADSTWSPAPRCTVVTCGPPSLPRAVVQIVPPDTHEYGAVTVVDCEAGYTTDTPTPRNITCLETGHWSHTPPCYEPCQPLTAPENGTLSNNGTLYGSTVHIQCLSGTGLLGSRTLYCTAHGNWSAEVPQCVWSPVYGHWTSFTPWSDCSATCGAAVKSRISYCILPEPRAIPCEGGAYEEESCDDVSCDVDAQWGEWGAWSLCSATCESGLRKRTRACSPHAGNGRPCNNADGIELETCEDAVCPQVSCPPIPAPAHASPDDWSQRKGTVVRYTCHDGYDLSGGERSMSVICNKSYLWQPSIAPSCSPVTCPLPALPKFMWREADDTTWNSTIVYGCHPGYTFPDGRTAASTRCLINKRWSHAIPPCQPVSCQVHDPSSSSPGSASGSVRYGETVDISCGRDRVFTEGLRVHTSICTASSRMSDVQQCHDNWCGALPYIENATPERTSSDSVQFECIYGHRFPDGHTVKHAHCMGDSWDMGDITACQAMACPPSPQSHNAVSNTSNALHGAVVRYDCTPGYWVTDGVFSSTIVCQNSGIWNGTAANCTEVVCRDPPVIVNASRDADYNTGVGAEVNYTCHEALRFHTGSRSISLHCSKRGMWLPMNVQCTALECPMLDIANHTQATQPYARHAGSRAAIHCASGYTFPDGTNEKNAECSQQGTWNLTDVERTCRVAYCASAPRIDHGQPITTTRIYNTTVTYVCEPAFRFPHKRPTDSLTCLDTGQWSKQPSPCKLQTCLPLPVWDNLVVNTSSLVFETVVNVSCADGHQFYPAYPSDTIITRCALHGAWFPAVPLCKPLNNIYREALAPTESPYSRSLGSTALLLLLIVLATIFLVDVFTSYRSSLRMLRRNFAHLSVPCSTP